MMDRNRKEAQKFSDLAKTASTPFLRAYYWNTALRYLSSEGQLSLAQSDSPTRLLGENIPLASGPTEVAARVPPASFAKQIDQQSLSAVNQDRSLESEETAGERHALEALKRLYWELHPLCIPAEDTSGDDKQAGRSFAAG
jgi:hypothetical protein